MQASPEDREMILGINVTPLVDVVLVLLIILMVTASTIVSKALSMDLPSAASGEATPSPLLVGVDADGQLFVDGTRVDEHGLERAAQASAERNADPRAMIAADGKVRHKNVVRVIDLLRGSGISKFAISVSPEALERAP